MSVSSATKERGKVTAKATSGTLVSEFSGRQALFVSNPSSKEVWLALGPEAKKEEGIWLKKETTLTIPITGYTGPISLITSEGEGTVTFVDL